MATQKTVLLGLLGFGIPLTFLDWFTFLNHFQGGRVKETKIIHVSIVRNSLTVRHSVRKSFDK